MGHVSRPAVAVLTLALLLAGGCSNDDGGSQSTSGAPTTESIATSTTSTIVAGPTSTAPVVTSSVTTTVAGTPVTTARPGATTTAAVAAGPAVAEAGGWRLVVSRPTARATIPPVASVCYQATGDSREPELELEVTATPPGTTVRVGIPVGQGTARVDLSAAGAGPHDLRIQLVVSGQRINGLSVTIPVTIAAGAPTVTC